MLEIQSIKQCNSGKLIHLAHSIKKKKTKNCLFLTHSIKKTLYSLKKYFFKEDLFFCLKTNI